MTPTPQSSVRRDSSDVHQTSILPGVPPPNAKDIPSQLSVFKDAVAQETTILIVSFISWFGKVFHGDIS